MTRAESAKGAVWGLSLVAVAIAGIWQQARLGEPPPRPMPCDRAALVDGRLLCDDELLAELTCPDGRQPRLDHPIVAGDALDITRLCAQPVAHPGDAGRGVARDQGWSRMSAAELALLEQPVELNRASEEELTSLPRVGPVLARRIVAGRPFAEVDDLLRVRGIGPVTLERLRARVVVDPPSP